MKPKCFGYQDEFFVPCAPKKLGGKGKKCEFKERCYKKTIKNLKKFSEGE